MTARRAFLQAGATISAAVAAGRLPAAIAQVPAAGADVTVLKDLLVHERRLQRIHRTAATAPTLSAEARGLAGRLDQQATSHVGALSADLGDRGAAVASVPLPAAAVPGLPAAVGSDAGYLRFATAQEAAAQAAQVAALGRLEDAALVDRVTGILGAAGGHLVALRALGGTTQLPVAFVTAAGA